MCRMDTFREVIDAFSTAEALALDIGEKGGTVRQWRNRDSIPAKAWGRIANAALDRGVPGVTVEKLAVIAERPAPNSEDAGRAA